MMLPKTERETNVSVSSEILDSIHYDFLLILGLISGGCFHCRMELIVAFLPLILRDETQNKHADIK